MTATLGLAQTHIPHPVKTGENVVPALAPVPVRREEPSTQAIVFELIVATQLLPESLLGEVAHCASQENIDILDYLFDKGFIAFSDHRELSKAVDLAKRNMVFKPWLIKATRRAILEFIPLDEVLDEMGLHPSSAFSDNPLAQLAQMAQMITASQFDQARRLALSTGMTLGQALVKSRGITVSEYMLLLDGMSRYKAGQVDLAGLKQVCRNGMDDFKLKGASAASISMERLGGFVVYCHSREALMAMALMVEAEKVECLMALSWIETAITNGQPIELVLSSSGDWHKELLFNKAMELALMVLRQNLTWSQAIGQLRLVA
jgi:hypothetical protein